MSLKVIPFSRSWSQGSRGLHSLACSTGSGDVTSPVAQEMDQCVETSRTEKDRSYWEGQGDLVTGLIMGIIGVSIWVIGVITLLTKSP